ncbi:hypothetical protein S40285_01865 [Stachybotrys chlorohalonatus IBT 40285]|uniref:Uncharacterized protein n=1 Tax=Stachybotrys chlorohalonatus (strain IBT 40285) TaxID=1283841 RepID=A0A084QQS3_STAC4|nr:hypothetical protein S40285_01865 [Stachybotrys chlorohalonata IBT 40285]
MAEEKENIMVSKSSLPPRTGKRQVCIRHCTRFWWIYLIVFCCIVALVVPLIILVAVPRIAQDRVDAADLEIVGIAITQTHRDGYTMEIDTILQTDGSIQAKIDPFQGSIYLEDQEPHTPFVRVNFPETSGERRQEIHVSQAVDIDDMDRFTTFSTWFINNETLRITVDGTTHVQPRGLPRKYEVQFKKTLEVNGMNRFRGTEIIEESSHVSIMPDENGRNFQGVAEFPNPSMFSLDIGNVSFTNFVGDDEVGTVYINDLTLRPGTNRLNVSGNLDQLRILGLVTSPEYCDNGTVPFKLLGSSVTNNGEHLEYFERALASNNQTVSIDIAQVIQQDLNITVGCAEDAVEGLLTPPGPEDVSSVIGSLLSFIMPPTGE